MNRPTKLKVSDCFEGTASQLQQEQAQTVHDYPAEHDYIDSVYRIAIQAFEEAAGELREEQGRINAKQDQIAETAMQNWIEANNIVNLSQTKRSLWKKAFIQGMRHCENNKQQ